MPRYNEMTGKYEFTERERAYMPTKNKKGTFKVPDRYVPVPEDQPAPPEYTLNVRPQDWVNVGTGRIEAQHEGEPDMTTLREVPVPPAPPEQKTRPEWKIDSLVCLRNGAGFKMRATEQVSGRHADVGFEPYYDAHNVGRGDVQALGKLLFKTYEEKGIEVTEPRRTPKPDLMEEMYQLLSIMMADPNVAEKYDSPWQTVKQQFDSLL